MKFKPGVKLDASQVRDDRWKAAARRKLANKYKFHKPVGLPKDAIGGVGVRRTKNRTDRNWEDF